MLLRSQGGLSKEEWEGGFLKKGSPIRCTGGGPLLKRMGVAFQEGGEGS